MKNLSDDLSRTLAGREYSCFLKDYGFSLVLDENGDDFSCTVFQSNEVLIAFTYQRGFGENLAVADVGAPIDAISIRARRDGWSLIGEVWKDAYQNYHEERKKLPYPHELNRDQEVRLITQILSTFMGKVGNKELSISNPEYRMNV